MSRALGKLGVASLVAAGLSGCGGYMGPSITGDNEVYLYFPAARMELPEPAQKWFGISLGTATAPAYLLTDDQLNVEPQLGTAARKSYGERYGRLDLQPSRRFTLSALVSLSDTEDDDGLVSGRLKINAIYPERAGERFSLSVTAARGEGTRGFGVRYDCGWDTSCTPQNARTVIEQTMTDGAIVLGYQLSRWGLLFGGPYYRRIDYELLHEADRGDSPDVRTAFDGHAGMAGVNFGVALRAFNWARLIVEASAGRVEAGPLADGFVQVGIAQEFYVGPHSVPTGHDATVAR